VEALKDDPQYSIEACVENVEEAVLAQKNGATRLELCSHLEVDGLTPSVDTVKEVLNNVTIPVKVMIRPRQSHFIYTPKELLKMTGSIYAMKELNVFGVVFGLLTYKRTVDFENTASLAEIAKPLNVTFHKAIDFTADVIESAKIISNIRSVDAILTSGARLTAMQGSHTINAMIDIVAGKTEIIAAGKITTENIDDIKQKINSNSFHGRKIVY